MTEIVLADARGVRHPLTETVLAEVVEGMPSEMWLTDSFDGAAEINGAWALILMPTDDRRFLVSSYDLIGQMWVVVLRAGPRTLGASTGWPCGEALVVRTWATLPPRVAAEVLRMIADAPGRPDDIRAVDLSGRFELLPIEDLIVTDDCF